MVISTNQRKINGINNFELINQFNSPLIESLQQKIERYKEWKRVGLTDEEIKMIDDKERIS